MTAQEIAYTEEQDALKTLESARRHYREMQVLCHDMPNAEAAPLLNGAWDALVIADRAFSSALQDVIDARGLVSDQPPVKQAPLVTKPTDQVPQALVTARPTERHPFFHDAFLDAWFDADDWMDD